MNAVSRAGVGERVVLTGAIGFLGQQIVRVLLERRPEDDRDILFACTHCLPLPFRAHHARAYPAVFAVCQTKSKKAEANLRHAPRDCVAGLNRFAKLR